MMKSSHVNWYNLNETRSYPFLPASRTASPVAHLARMYDGLDDLYDNRLVADLSIATVPALMAGNPYPAFKLGYFHVSGGAPADFSGATVHFVILYRRSADDQDGWGYLRASVPMSDTRGYRTVELQGYSPLGDLAGSVVFGAIERLLAEAPPGSRFARYQAAGHALFYRAMHEVGPVRVDPRVIRVFIPPRIPYVRERNGGVLGDVRVEGGVNAGVRTPGPGVITLSPDAATAGNLAPIWRPGGASAGAIREEDAPGRSGYARGVRSINGVPADSSGRITLEFR